MDELDLWLTEQASDHAGVAAHRYGTVTVVSLYTAQGRRYSRTAPTMHEAAILVLNDYYTEAAKAQAQTDLEDAAFLATSQREAS